MLFTEPGDEWPSDADLDSGPSQSGSDSHRDRLCEQSISTRGVTVDKSGRCVRNVAIAGCVSRNGYRYTPESLEAAVPLYEGRPVFLDHASDTEQPLTRSTRDLVGTLAHVKFVRTNQTDGSSDRSQGMIRADIRVVDTESGRTFLALCESDEPGVGMSHVVLARRSADGTVVESIEKVVSVDAVTFPATTTRLSEQADTTDQNRCVRVDCGTRIREAEAECTRLREELSRLERQAALVDRERMLAVSGLPADAVSVVFRETVLNAVDNETARSLIRDRLNLLRVSQAGPTSDARTTARGEPDTFAAAIRGVNVHGSGTR